MKADPVAAQLFVNERGGAWCGDGSRRAAALISFLVWQEGRFFVPAYDSYGDARSVGQGRSGATRSREHDATLVVGRDLDSDQALVVRRFGLAGSGSVGSGLRREGPSMRMVTQ